MTFSEKIAEARKIAQRDSDQSRGRSWYSEYFTNRFSIYISYVLWKAGIAPNTVTVAMGLVGMAGSICMVLGNIWLTVLGAILWQLWFILDCVDGEVARLSRKTSLLGVYLDELTHIFVNPTFCLALGVHVCLQQWTVLNAVTAMVLYSAFNWMKQVHRVSSRSLVIKGGVDATNVTSYRFNSKSLSSWLRLLVVQAFKEIGQIFIVPIVILADHIVNSNAAEYFLYGYLILYLAYLAMLIVRDGLGIQRMDTRADCD